MQGRAITVTAGSKRMASDSLASAAELLRESSLQVEEIQSISAQLLGALAASVDSPDTAQQICFLNEKLQQLAAKGDAAFGKAQDLIRQAKEPSVDGLLGVNASQVKRPGMQEAPGQPESLQDIVASVKYVSGLDIQCVSYPQRQSSLLDALTPNLGCDSQDATEVWVIIEGVMRAAVALQARGQPEAVTVAVYSANEDGKDAWSGSDHQVYRRVSAVAMRALFHFQQQVKSGEDRPTEALHKLLLWICSYRNLLSSKCSASGIALAVDTATQHLMPPIVRPFRVSMEELKIAASAKARSPAYHMHSAPGYVL